MSKESTQKQAAQDYSRGYQQPPYNAFPSSQQRQDYAAAYKGAAKNSK